MESGVGGVDLPSGKELPLVFQWRQNSSRIHTLPGLSQASQHLEIHQSISEAVYHSCNTKHA